MKCEKPITDNMKQKCNDFWLYMKSKNDYVTEAEQMSGIDESLFNFNYTPEPSM